MKTNTLKMLTLACCGIALSIVVNGQIVTPTNCFPAQGGTYSASNFGEFNDGNTYTITNAELGDFGACDPVPPAGSGGIAVHATSATFHAMWSVNGFPPQPITAPVQVTYRITDAGPDGSGNELYQTEMLQLDIQGGTLPAGVMLRESPTLQSTGQIKTRPVAGGYRIDSFFDIFPEMSVNGGMTWMQSSMPASHMTLPTTAAIPTLGEWGLIILGSLMVITAGTILFRRGIFGA